MDAFPPEAHDNCENNMELSHRAQAYANASAKYLMWSIIQDLWHPEDNPTGYLSLGVAENTLMSKSIIRHIQENFALPSQSLTYGDGTTGSRRLKKAMANFLTEHLKSHAPLEMNDITITNGCSASIEHLAWALSNPGEGILLGRPYFRGFLSSMTLRTGVKVVPVSFDKIDPFTSEGVDCYEAALIQSQKAGVRISAIMLCNPHNPTGRCYSREALLGLMSLCEKYQIHLISDELYALSVWKNDVDSGPAPSPFESCLSFDTRDLIDPSRLHIIWGMSKDLSANGLRIGAIISQSSPRLHSALVPVALFSSSSSAADHITANILEDGVWMRRYIQENSRLLSRHYNFVVDWAIHNGIEHYPGANAAFFVMLNLGKVFRKQHPNLPALEAERLLNGLLLERKVFLVTGEDFGSEEPGWFRLTFAYPESWIAEGLRRILAVVQPISSQ